MQVIQSQLGITRILSDVNKHLLSRKSNYISCGKWHHSIIKPIGVQEPLIKASRLFLSRKYNKSLNPLVPYTNWDEGGLANDSMLTDYSEVNYSNDIFDNITKTKNHGINGAQKIDNSNPNSVTQNNNYIDNIISKKSQQSNIKKQHSNKTKTSTKPAKKSKLKEKSKNNPKNNNLNSQTSVESFSKENIHQKNTDISSTTDGNSDPKIDSSFLQLDDSQVLEYEDNNQNTQVLEKPDLFENKNREAKLNSDNTSNLFTYESSIVEKSGNNILLNPTQINVNTVKSDNKDNNNIIESKSINQLSSKENLSDIKTEELSKNITNELTENKSVTHDITSSTAEEASEDKNNQDLINSDSSFPIPDTTKQAEIPLDKLITTTTETQNNQFVSVENQEDKNNIYPEIVNSDIQKAELLRSQNLNRLSNNFPITSPIAKTATVINDYSNYQHNHNQDTIQAEIPLDNIISANNNQPNISKTNSNQELSNLSRSQPITTTTNETQNNQIIPAFTDKKLPINSDKSTEYQSIYAENLEIKHISDVIENITDNDELIEPKLRDVNSHLSTSKQTDIASSEIEKTSYISREQDAPSYSPDVENLIQTTLDVEDKKREKEEKILPISTFDINIDISNNIYNREDFPENLLESSSETEIIFKNPDLLVEQNKPDIQKTITTEQESEKKSDFNHKFNQKLDRKQIIQGYATGGKVIESKVENNQEIAPSDTVPAMLTPGEFVVNAKDTQQNFDVLQHINSGKKVEEIIQPSLEKSISPEIPNTLLQKEESQVISSPASSLLTSPPLGLEIGENRLSLLSSPHTNQPENTNYKNTPSSTNNYSSSTLIFRKQNNHLNTNEVPSQWTNIEELLNSENSESDDFTTLFNFGGEQTDSQTPSDSVRIAPKPIAQIKSFNQSREAILPDISRDIEPISETIQNPSFTNEADKTKNEQQDTQDLEVLAHEIYLRLRQRLEIEKERLGVSFGRLPW